MYTIEEFLNTKDIDWDIHQKTGLCVINKQDYDNELLTGINNNTIEQVEILNFGDTMMICPKSQCNDVIRMMDNLGYKIEKGDNKMLIENKKKFNYVVEQAADELNSKDTFKQFSKAMKILGEQLGIGPIQEKLKKRGISYKLNGEKDSLIFYIKNDKGENQPIARISKSQLKSQNDFQNNLEMMVDMAMGNPPGTIKSKQDKLREQQSIISDLSRVVFPSDKSSQVANLMLSKD